MIFRKMYLRLIGDYPCALLVETITEYLEGTMPEPERVRFDRHLKNCPSCQVYVEMLRHTIEETGRITVEYFDALPRQARAELMDAFRAFHAKR